MCDVLMFASTKCFDNKNQAQINFWQALLEVCIVFFFLNELIAFLRFFSFWFD